MPTYLEKKQMILPQYFIQYLDVIYPSMELYNHLIPQYKDGSMNVMHTMFLCSVVDHFAKVMRVAHIGSDLPLRGGQNTANFKFFIETYFPDSAKCKWDIIYKLFRNGVMHQFFPKFSGVYWSNEVDKKDMLIRESDAHLPDLNNYTFSNYIQQALQRIMIELNEDVNPQYIDAMYNHIEIRNPGFNDGSEYQQLVNDYAARGKTLYDPC